MEASLPTNQILNSERKIVTTHQVKICFNIHSQNSDKLTIYISKESQTNASPCSEFQLKKHDAPKEYYNKTLFHTKPADQTLLVNKELSSEIKGLLDYYVHCDDSSLIDDNAQKISHEITEKCIAKLIQGTVCVQVNDKITLDILPMGESNKLQKSQSKVVEVYVVNDGAQDNRQVLYTKTLYADSHPYDIECGNEPLLNCIKAHNIYL